MQRHRPSSGPTDRKQSSKRPRHSVSKSPLRTKDWRYCCYRCSRGCSRAVGRHKHIMRCGRYKEGLRDTDEAVRSAVSTCLVDRQLATNSGDRRRLDLELRRRRCPLAPKPPSPRKTGGHGPHPSISGVGKLNPEILTATFWPFSKLRHFFTNSYPACI